MGVAHPLRTRKTGGEIMTKIPRAMFATLLSLLLVSGAADLARADEESNLAKQTQNPVADLISVPFQNNFNFDFGPENETQYILNIQPVIPIKLNDEWNLITRTILPVVYQPETFPGTDSEFGLSDTLFTAFFSPSKPDKLIWGAGPAIQIPTATDDYLGTEEWAIGPSAVALTMQGPWVAGGLISNIWGDDINKMTLQPFVNYNLPSGAYLTSSPLITADWEASSDDTWTVPVGGGVGKVFRIGKLPLNCQIQGFYNVEKPDIVGDWSLRIQFQFLFPK
jgi:hypothetical protein